MSLSVEDPQTLYNPDFKLQINDFDSKRNPHPANLMV